MHTSAPRAISTKRFADALDLYLRMGGTEPVIQCRQRLARLAAPVVDGRAWRMDEPVMGQYQNNVTSSVCCMRQTPRTSHADNARVGSRVAATPALLIGHTNEPLRITAF
jgi:hypothetical protein